MNRKINLFVALAAAALFTACSSSADVPVSKNVNVGPASTPYVTSPSNAANNANQMAVSGPYGLPNLAKGEDYRRLRYKMIDAGWTPARSEEGKKNCVAESSACKEFPELESGPAAGEGRMALRWKLSDRVVHLYTVGDPAVYESYRFEKKAYAPTPKPASNKLANANSNVAKSPVANTNAQKDADEPADDASAEEDTEGN